MPDGVDAAWVQRWEVISARLTEEALRRGGTVVRDGWQLKLHAPRLGTCIRVVMLEEETALIHAELGTFAATWALADDDPENLEQAVRSIMDGRGQVDAWGSFHVEFEGGGSIGRSPIDKYRRTLPAWGT